MSETIKDSLVMTFNVTDGDNINVTVYDQKADLTAETVSEAMQDVVNLEVLMDKNGNLADGVFAAKTVRQITNQLF